MNITIKGRSGHGAMPHYAVDPIYVGAKVVDALQSIASRETNAMDTVVVSICTFHSGTMANIFAETAELSGTVRTFNPELRKQLPGMIERIIKSTCEAYRADYEFDYYCDIPATINDERCSEIAAGSVKKLLGEEGLIEYAALEERTFPIFWNASPVCMHLWDAAMNQKAALIHCIMNGLIWMRMRWLMELHFMYSIY